MSDCFRDLDILDIWNPYAYGEYLLMRVGHCIDLSKGSSEISVDLYWLVIIIHFNNPLPNKLFPIVYYDTSVQIVSWTLSGEHFLSLSTRLIQEAFEGLIWKLFKYGIDIGFLNGNSLASKMSIFIIVVLKKASWIWCPFHNYKINKPSFHAARFQVAPSISQTIWTLKH